MSESFLIAGILSISGGLQDAYTYMYRGKVFANAQTGNIVLLAQNLVDRNWQAVLRYFSPLLFFALGVAMAECIRMEIPEGTEDPLETAGTCDRNTFVVCSRFFTE